MLTTLTVGLLAAPGALAGSRVESDVLAAVRAAGFDQVYDWGADADTSDLPGVPTPHLPNVDVAVLDLSPRGEVRGVAHVLYSRDQPGGLVVPTDRRTLGSESVDYRRWSTAAYDNDASYDSTATLTGTRGAGTRFMTPHPASLLKSMVLYAVTRLADRGQIDPAAAYAYPGGDDGLCGPSTPETRTVDEWSRDMIETSSNSN